MVFKYLQVLTPIISFIINVLAQIVMARFFPKLGLLKSLFLAFLLGVVSIFFFEFYVFFTYQFFIADLITYSSLGYCYFHFVNLGETSTRIRILRELHDSPDGLSLEEILTRYNAGEIISKRITRLINNGQIIFKDGAYYIGNPAMLISSKIIEVMKGIIFGKKYLK